MTRIHDTQQIMEPRTAMTVTPPHRRNWSGIIVGLVLVWTILAALAMSAFGYHAAARGVAPGSPTGATCPF